MQQLNYSNIKKKKKSEMTIRRNQLCMSRPTRQLQRTKHSEAQYNNKNRQHQPNFTLVGTEQSMGSASEKYRRRRSIRRGSGRRRRGYCGARTAEFDSFPAATVDKERGCGRRVELMRSERTLGVLHPLCHSAVQSFVGLLALGVTLQLEIPS